MSLLKRDGIKRNNNFMEIVFEFQYICLHQAERKLYEDFVVKKWSENASMFSIFAH